MIGQILIFWLAATVTGLVVWPLVWSILKGLPDRGFGFMRTAGLLLTAYLYWLGGVLGFVPNNAGGMIGVIILAAMGSGLLISRCGKEFIDWHRDNLRLIIITELVFLTAFGFWAFVRANNPDLVATEKPMELAFLNSILISPAFPPRDPWLSGYSISYYYFGYIMIAGLTRLSSLTSGVTFNLANAMWFGLGCVGSYSIIRNLLHDRSEPGRSAVSLLGPLFVMVSGNLEGVLEVLHKRGLFWRISPDGTRYSSFWEWLGIKQLVDPPAGSVGWIPDRYLWWWRASRVVNDVNLRGDEVEVIDEFPFFSFILADNHPHVLALPFVLLAVGFALHIYLKRREHNIGMLALPGGIWVPLSYLEFLFAALLFGGLAFLNTWDLPIYLVIVAGSLFLSRSRKPMLSRLISAAAAGAALVAASVLLYLPWLAGFRSQLGGILPNLIYPTRFVQFLIMFGVSIVPLSMWLVDKASRSWTRKDWKPFLLLGLGIPVVLWLVSLGLSGVIRSALQDVPGQFNDTLNSLGASSMEVLINAVIQRRLNYSWTALFLGGMIGIIWVLFMKVEFSGPGMEEGKADYFILLMVGVGALLVLGAEFLYLRDLFSTRMNTVFKFYYAAWILWGLSAAWIAAKTITGTGWFSRVISTVSMVMLIAGLLYSVLAVWTKTSGFSPHGGRTLDGTAYLKESSTDYAAIGWITDNLSPGVITEAVGGSYSQYGRISVHTGFPTVLGWPFHEYQWRGTLEYSGSRESDIQRLYQTRNWEEAQTVISEYDIQYVYVGSLENQKYQPLFENKFMQNMDLVYRDEFVSIYQVKTP